MPKKQKRKFKFKLRSLHKEKLYKQLALKKHIKLVRAGGNKLN